jgi:hypothetical protein
MDLKSILEKVQGSVDLSTILSTEEQALLVKETMNPEDLIRDDLELEDAALIGLRIFSLLTATDVEGHEWSAELEALSYSEDKELLSLLKKLVKLDAFKLRHRTTKVTVEATPVDDNPLL